MKWLLFAIGQQGIVSRLRGISAMELGNLPGAKQTAGLAETMLKNESA